MKRSIALAIYLAAVAISIYVLVVTIIPLSWSVVAGLGATLVLVSLAAAVGSIPGVPARELLRVVSHRRL